MSDQIQEIKDRVNIADLIGNYVELKSSGSNLKGLCPFHQEKSPSFMVNEERQIYKCFGCGDGGDVFTFLERIEGFNFRETLEYLAEKTGIVLKKNNAQDWEKLKDQKTRIYGLNRATASFFHFLLINHPSGKRALDYLINRGLSTESLKKFNIGYAPPNYQLRGWLFKKGFNDLDLAGAGRPEKFRDRVMFPLKDALGNIVGFTGRSLDDQNQPKYLNSPETQIFKKNKNIYGLSESKDTIRQLKSIILTEGQMDVITSHQAGFCNTVASSGTALTIDHLKILRRYSEELILVFDNDEAGQKATLKTIELAQGMDFNLKTISIPEEFKDADEAIRTNPELWGKAINEARPALENIILKETGNSDKIDATKKKVVAKKILPIIKLLKDPIEKSHYLNFLATVLVVPESALIDALQNIHSPTDKQAKVDTQAPQSVSLYEELFLLAVIDPGLYKSFSIRKEDLKAEIFASQIDSALANWYDDSRNLKTTDRKSLADFIRKSLGREQSLKFDLFLSEIERRHGDSDIEKIAIEIQEKIKIKNREQLKINLATKIKFAEEAGDRARVKELVAELQKSLVN